MNEQEKEILELVNQWSAATINQLRNIPEAHLNRMVAGQLKNCIKAHGPITSACVGSAAKRITNQLLGVVNE